MGVLNLVFTDLFFVLAQPDNPLRPSHFNRPSIFKCSIPFQSNALEHLFQLLASDSSFLAVQFSRGSDSVEAQIYLEMWVYVFPNVKTGPMNCITPRNTSQYES